MKKQHKIFSVILLWIVISTTGLTAMPAYAATPDDYIPNAAGGLRIGVAQRDKTTVLLNEPDLVKIVFGLGWNRVRDEWNERIVTFINEVGDQGFIEVVSDLATSDQAELRVMKIDKGASLKYILHDNKMHLTLNLPESIELAYVVDFDIEMVLAIQASNQEQQLRLTDVVINIRNTEIDGVDWKSRLTVPLIEALFQSIQEQAEKVDNPLLPLMREIIRQFTPFVEKVLKQIPENAIYTDISVSPTDGVITFCFKSNAKGICRFQ